jgi:protein-tyrosine-phosphatase
MPSILFVCTANQCRSPMAEVLFKQKLSERSNPDGWTVESAAAWGASGERATENARQVAAENDLDLDPHRSQRVEDIDLNAFDLILVMQAGHQEGLRTEFPHLAERIRLLSEMSGSHYDVRDPAGEDIESYLRTWNEIEGLIDAGFERIIAQGDRGAGEQE